MTELKADNVLLNNICHLYTLFTRRRRSQRAGMPAFLFGNLISHGRAESYFAERCRQFKLIVRSYFDVVGSVYPDFDLSGISAGRDSKYLLHIISVGPQAKFNAIVNLAKMHPFI